MSIKVVFCFCFFFPLTSQYQLIVKNYDPGLGALSVEGAIKCIASLLTELPFTQWRNLDFTAEI